MSRFDVEAAVLGAMMLDPQAYWKVADLITADDFSTAEYRDMWETIQDLRKAGIDADVVTVGDKMPGRNVTRAGVVQRHDDAIRRALRLQAHASSIRPYARARAQG